MQIVLIYWLRRTLSKGLRPDTKVQKCIFSESSRSNLFFFVAASRSGGLDLNLQAGEALNRIFFTMDSGHATLQISIFFRFEHRDMWREFKREHLCDTFVSIGADRVSERMNRFMKVNGRLIGISNNLDARQRLFFIAPVISRFSKAFKNQLHLSGGQTDVHSFSQQG